MTPEKKTGKSTKKTKPKSTTKRKTVTSRKTTGKPKTAAKRKAPTKSTTAAKPRAATTKKLPEQKLGDTPVAPWEMPKPEEKEQVKPVKQALKKAVAEVDSQEKADQVIQRLEEKTAGKTAEELDKKKPKKAPATMARQVKQAEAEAPEGQKAEKVLDATAKALSTQDKRQKELVSEAAQEVFNPQQQGVTPPPETEEQREFLRQAVLKRLKPLDAVDANLFLKVNHLNHTRLLNTMFYGLTFVFTGGAAWYGLMGLSALKDRRSTGEIIRDIALPLAISGYLVEHPIKKYFKRRRPFITIIQAIVIGKKPGSWSFPSGHSATAFAGAYLLNQKWPRLGIVRYIIAGSVAFSRIYLGDHYPGDVLSGSILGALFAATLRWGIRKVFGKKG